MMMMIELVVGNGDTGSNCRSENTMDNLVAAKNGGDGYGCVCMCGCELLWRKRWRLIERF